MGKSRSGQGCPICREIGQVRTSREVSIFEREYYYQCPNIECGHRWRAMLINVSDNKSANKPQPQIGQAEVSIPLNKEEQSELEYFVKHQNTGTTALAKEIYLIGLTVMKNQGLLKLG